ncbi:MAG: succinate dehydrogenase iron-sulfur subunit [Actinomycetota bacterium]
MAGGTIELRVTRYRPDRSPTPWVDTFRVPYDDDTVVLDALNHVKDEVDGTLTFRWSCRMGVCGSCGMMIGGEPRLSCGAFLRDLAPGPVTVEPLRHFPVLRDLVVDTDDFLEALREVRPWLIPRRDAADGDGEGRQTPAQVDAYRQFSMCINCMLCYAACPVYGQDRTFLGPAAIALAHRYDMDSRDGGRDVRRRILGRDEGVWECTFVGECSAVCPKGVDPAAAIQRSKVDLALRAWRVVWPAGAGR